MVFAAAAETADEYKYQDNIAAIVAAAAPAVAAETVAVTAAQ